MTIPLYAGTGDPSALQRAIGVQSADGIPVALADAFPFLCYGGVITPSPKWLPRLALSLRPMRKLAMGSKVDIEGLSMNMGDLDPSNHAHLLGLMSFFQGYDAATADGHTRWRLSQAQYATNPFLNKLTYFNDSDKGLAIKFVDSVISSWSLGIQPRSNAALNFGWQVGRYDFWTTGVVTTGTGVVPPLLRHAMDEQFDASATTGDVVITIVSDDATTVTFTVTKGGGAASANQTATKGVWSNLYLGTPAVTPLGKRAQQIQGYFPVGANGSFVDADVWTFQSRYVLGYDAADYPTPRPMAETQFRFFFGDGTEVVVDNGVTLNGNVPGAVTRYSAGGEQPVGGDRRGQHEISISLNRRLVDMELQAKLMQRDQVAFIAEVKNDTVVGTSAFPWGVCFVAPNCTIEGQLHDAAEGGQNYDEEMTLQCYEPDSAFDLSAVLPQYTGINDIEADLEVIFDTDIDETDLGL